jgi:hypothetical protein
MWRQVLGVLAAVSLVACLATVAFWASGKAWSPSAVVRETRPVTGRRYAVVLGYEAVVLQVLRPAADPGRKDGDLVVFWGFAYVSGAVYGAGLASNTVLGEVRAVHVPYWFVVLATAALPAWWVYPVVRRRFVTPAGHCGGCGYDLRASPERCPECGAVAANGGKPVV